MKYFKMFEFSCHHCGRVYPKVGMNPVLLEKLDQLRGNRTPLLKYQVVTDAPNRNQEWYDNSTC